jgi:hypothetical protein
MKIVVETTANALRAHIPAWESLAAAAIEPNPFYEHWMLIPALREFADRNVRILFVYNSQGDERSAVLCGVIPIVRQSSYRKLPISNLSLWKHKYCFHCTPLLRAGFAERVLTAYCDWAEQNSNLWSLTEFNETSGDGLFAQLVNDELARRGCRTYQVESFERAMLEPAVNGETYLQTNVSGGRLKEFRRQFNRLKEKGEVDFVELDREEDLEDWIQNFMDLEASGWKGRAGSAMLLDEASRNFFSEVVGEAFRRSRLVMTGLRLDGKPIALKCNLLAEPGGFAFKIAFNEEYAHFSPGIQLELETILRIHRRPRIRWMDSCAVPNHPMIDHLWMERRRIRTVTVPMRGRFALAIDSLLGLRTRSIRAVNRLRAVLHA